MKSVAPLGFITIVLLSLCSCSGPADTAEIPEVAPIHLQASRLPKKIEEVVPLTDALPQPETEQPASIMARQLKDLGSEDANYSSDSFFATQTNFEVPVVDEVTVEKKVDFSGNLIAK